MNELSLFTGAGGGLLGTTLLGWRHIGYVEWDQYCQRIIEQRIKDGILDDAPIFGDIREFNKTYAREYQGMVDVITAGFPCQPFSVAGKQRGEEDERNMWPATIECIRIIRPRYALLENVPGLLANKYIQRIFGDVAEAGYDARWCVLGAYDCGAPHTRKRLWILAANSNDKYSEDTIDGGSEEETSILRRKSKGNISAPSHEAETAHNFSQRIQGSRKKKIQRKQGLSWGEVLGSFEELFRRSDIPIPLICRVDDGVPNYMDRIKAIGNAQVPAVVATAWRILKPGF